MSAVVAFHGSPYHFDQFHSCAFGLHFGTYDQAVHAATIKLGRLPLKEFERLARVSDNAFLGKIYKVELQIGNLKRISDPRSSRDWRRQIDVAMCEGFDSIVYANDFEGRVPADSFCVFNPDQIHILSVE